MTTDTASSGATAVELRGCARTWPDGTRALTPIDLDIPAGRTAVLLGPSGCGKTTLLRIIAGLDRPDAGGRVLFDGEDVTRLPIEAREVGMVFQSYALFPNLTVRGNVAYGLKVRRLPRREIDSRVDEMLALMRIDTLADRRIDQLSGGQRQRTALARAIAVRPRLLLLDEPLTALDAALREHLRTEIDALLRSLHITAVYVTHDQAEAMVLGDEIVVMNAGRIAQRGTPREIYHAPADDFVAGFVGTMNRAMDGRGETLLFRPEDARLTTPGDGLLTGTVAVCHFLGDRCRLKLSGPAGESWMVETTARADLPETGTLLGIDVPAAARIRLGA
ncbi:ABC transporter ATP-binding protein [Tistrella mobilis]|uniref:ABC transporter n=1 Tax=Tistrella mobilis (strain KA081020-065) TaxID=1110502 RepID=I3TRD6_TISMK|nr:ABC transporter ATP-binding protein [Tistrella mobilis]AFK55324.1 putative ABC transporter [Tistrella mobilis KA081020-065]